MDKEIKVIGFVHSPLKSLEDCPMQEFENAPEASIVVHPEFVEAIGDIGKGSEIILLTWLDKSDRTVLTTRPRNNPDAPLTGVFSTRSHHRPNPIGLHQVTVLAVEKDRFRVSGLEVLDQTPVIDIKPVLK